jgi:hypothetical protein
VTALDYRNDRAYRQSSTTYQGSQIAAVTVVSVAGTAGVGAPAVSGSAFATPAVLSSAAAVPTPAITGDASVVPATLTVVAAVPAASVAGDASVGGGVVAVVVSVGDATVTVAAQVAAGSIAGLAQVSSVDVRSTVDVAAGVVGGVAAAPVAAAAATADVVLDTLVTGAGVAGVRLGRHVVTNTTASGPRVAEGSDWYDPFAPENRLARFYTPRDVGVNVWIVSDATVTTDHPADEATITRTIHGGHDSPDLTDTEADLLIAAGYDMTIGERVAA